MIESIQISNFKSIIHADVKLNPFTVIVGANGSGKSNLVKALELLGTIPGSGLAGAMTRLGGFNSLIPRTLSTREAKKSEISFSYRMVLPLPDNYGANLPPPAVEHEIKIGHSKTEGFRLVHEKLVFHQVLAVAQALDDEEVDDDEVKHEVDSSQYIVPSYFTLEKGPLGGVKYYSEPPLKQEIQLYWKWLGLSFLEE
jgi:predicted ATPase